MLHALSSNGFIIYVHILQLIRSPVIYLLVAELDEKRTKVVSNKGYQYDVFNVDNTFFLTCELFFVTSRQALVWILFSLVF